MSKRFLKRQPSKVELRRGRPHAEYHVFTHAVEGLNPFATDELKAAWADTLRRRLPGAQVTKFGPEIFHDIDVLAHAAMGNHPHLVLAQGEDATSVSRFTGNVLRAFALRYNHLTGHRGPVFVRPFEAKFLATPTDLRRAIAYVHRNPKRADLINRFTSHPAYLAEDGSSFVNVARGLSTFGGRDGYADFFEKYCRAKDAEEGR
jgi:hypothetical protein